MADNTTLPGGSGGDTLRTEDRTSFKTPVSLLDVGGTGGSEAIIGDSGVYLPVKVAAAGAEVDGHSATLGATADSPASTDTGTFSLIALFKRLLQKLSTQLPAALSNGFLKVSLQESSVSQAVTDGGGSLTVDGTVTANAGSGTFTVGGTVSLTDISNGEYETVAASSTDQVLGATGAAGDYLAGLLIVPASTSPGAVSIKDGSGNAITLFAGGASSVSNLVPFMVPLGIKSTGGAWKVTTGSSVSAIGVGNFT